MMNQRALVEKTHDADLLREVVACRPIEPAIEGPSHRNGYRDRAWETRAGTVELACPHCARAAPSPPSWSGPHGRGGAERRDAGGHVQGVLCAKIDKVKVSRPVRSRATGPRAHWRWVLRSRTPSCPSAPSWDEAETDVLAYITSPARRRGQAQLRPQSFSGGGLWITDS